MTSIEWLIKELYTEMNMNGDGRVLDEILEEAKEMHKQELGKTWDSALDKYEVRAGNYMRAYEDFDDYYQETFVSKGSGMSEKPNNHTNSEIPNLLEISDEEIEEEISKRYMHPTMDYAFRDACKWYREQLKQRQNKNNS